MMKRLLTLLLVLPLYLSASFELCLPVNATTDPQVDFCIYTPEGYYNLQPIGDLINQSSYILEFVPNGQTGDDWSDIITAVLYTGLGLTAKYSIDQLKYGIPDLATSAKILDERVRNKDSYQYATITISYDLGDDHQLLVARYYSGPYDQSGIQYTVRLPSAKDDARALKQINEWLDENTELVD